MNFALASEGVKGVWFYMKKTKREKSALFGDQLYKGTCESGGLGDNEKEGA